MESLRKKFSDRFSSNPTSNNSDDTTSIHSGSYNESTLRQYWMPDQVAVECYDCAAKFTTFRRKHHCRICGQIFCSKCCGVFISGRYLNVHGSIRVCNSCYQNIEENPPSALPNVEQGAYADGAQESYAEVEDFQRFSQLVTKSGSDSDLTKDPTLTNVPVSTGIARSESRKSSYAGVVPNIFMSESFDNISDLGPLELQKLVNIWQKMSTSHPIPTRSHKYKMKVYPETFNGEDLIHWLHENEGIVNRQNAEELAQALLDEELIIDQTNLVQKGTLCRIFAKSVPFKLKQGGKYYSKQNLNSPSENIEEISETSSEGTAENDDLAPEWLQNIEQKTLVETQNSSRAELKPDDANPVKMSSPATHEDLSQFLNKFPSGGNSLEISTEIPCPALDDVFHKHQAHYLEKLLQVEKLNKEKWTEFIQIQCNKLMNEVELEPSVDRNQINMDITDLIKIKCISQGRQTDSRIVRGEVFTNCVIRTDMPMSASNARLLLVQESISYHRPDKFVSIHNLHLQEEEFVKNICNKIKALNPDLILVGENIVQRAQDELVKAGISVIQNVKQTNLQRISRLFNTQILPNLASLVSIPTLGLCEKFHNVFYEHQEKNLVYLEGYAKPKGGSCLVLRGGSRIELSKVKRVMKQFLLLKTHATFEKAFILDEPSQVDNFIVPDYKSCHVTQLSLSPFVQLPLPDNELLKAINADCDSAQSVENFDGEENESMEKAPAKAKTVPLILTTSLQKDVKVRNMLADLRATPIRIKRVNKVAKKPLPPIPKLYEVLNRNLPMSFCSYLSSPDGGARYCIKPWVSTMKCYRDSDLPLGLFLISYCFDKKVRCRSTQDAPSTGISTTSISAWPKTTTPCPIPMSDHGRRFCLGNTSITLIIQDLKDNITNPDDEDQIVLWKFCPECQTMTDLLPLSNDAWKMSYGMFLLLLIHENKMVRQKFISCTHPLHNFQFTCFGRHNQIAFFKMQTVVPHRIKLPPQKIPLPDQKFREKELRDELSNLAVQGSSVYGQLNEKLVQLQNEFEACSSPTVQTAIRDLIGDQKNDFDINKQKVDKISTGLEQDPSLRDPIQAQSDILMLKISIIKDVTNWRVRLSKFFELKKKEDKVFAKTNSKNRIASGNTAAPLDFYDQQPISLPAILTSDNSTPPNSKIDKTKEENDVKKKNSTGSTVPVLSEQDFVSLDCPFPNTIHPDLYFKPHVLVDENQPSSIIAYALGSTEYAEFLSNADPKKHWDHQFYDNGGADKFFVKVHFALEFHTFRKQIFAAADHQEFLASLGSCDPWQSSGGKSGASFYKTTDGRFLLKQINKHEIDTLKTTAHKYFEYITTNKHRTLMAKIVGLYTVGYKTSNGGAHKLDLVVMENLFHEHKIVESFDLKGSVRNRLVDPSRNNVQGKELVLMDENFLRMACEKPFYVNNKTKMELRQTVDWDSKFLSDNKIMDYSLLVGKDENTKELVVGIIDYLRPFSLDKIIESQVKKTSGYFQGTAEDPTVISPSAYRTRFISAMDNYFVLLPDYWYDMPPSPPITKDDEDEN